MNLIMILIFNLVQVSFCKAGNIHDYEEKQKNLNDDIETMIIDDNLDEYGKVVDDSLETFANLRKFTFFTVFYNFFTFKCRKLSKLII